MCKRRLFRRMERNSPGDDPHPLLTYILLKSFGTFHSKSIGERKQPSGAATYTIAMEEIEACIAAPNTVEAEIEAKELARIIESIF